MMTVNYKQACRQLNKQYADLLKRFDERADVNLIVYWLNDDDRKAPMYAFTSGPERLLAYHIAVLLEKNKNLKGE